MREILFRGKRKDNGEWVYGDLLINGIDYETAIRDINTPLGRREITEVDPETVGQWTGLKDKFGNRIFEGDIVHYDVEETAEIAWDKETARFVLNGDGVCYDFDNFYGRDLEVIWNIH